MGACDRAALLRNCWRALLFADPWPLGSARIVPLRRARDNRELWGENLKGAQNLEAIVKGTGIMVLASGVVNGITKMYFFAQDGPSYSWFLSEVTVTAAGRLSAVVKAQDATLAPQFSAFFKKVLAPFVESGG